VALVPPDVDPSVLTVAARRVLLDALVALQSHLQALVLVGAQAVYLRSGALDLGVAVFTSDGDVGLDPELLHGDPLLEAALTEAGFTRDIVDHDSQPGTWFLLVRIDGKQVPIAVDLLTPDSLAGGRRSADLPPHGRGSVRRVAGIELALEDHDTMPITSLEPDRDDRSLTLRVAGTPALLVAKAYKIHDRATDDNPRRRGDKDAADVYRLMVTADPFDVAETFAHLVASPRVGAIARTGLDLLRAQFGAPRAPGVEMAVRALAASVPENLIRQNAPAFTQALRTLP
jgi:hypothetical protein